MTPDNPYASPEATLGRPDRDPGLAKSLIKWGWLAPINSIASLFLAQNSAPRGGGDPEADLTGLTFFSWPQMIAGIAIIAIALALLDHAFARRGRRFLSRALTSGAIAKAGLQLILSVDLIIGLISIGIVNSLPDRGGALAVLFATLLCGAIAVGVAFGIGLILAGIGSALAKRPASQPDR